MIFIIKINSCILFYLLKKNYKNLFLLIYFELQFSITENIQKRLNIF